LSSIFFNLSDMVLTGVALWIFFGSYLSFDKLRSVERENMELKKLKLQANIDELKRKIEYYKSKVRLSADSHEWLLTLSSIVQEIGSAENYSELINKLKDIVEKRFELKLEKVLDPFMKELLRVKKRSIVKDEGSKKYYYGAIFSEDGVKDIFRTKFLIETRQILDFIFNIASEKNMELELIERLTFESRTDFLTGLFNRVAFLDVAKDEFLLAKRLKTQFVFAILDIDNFKSINDTYGHKTGDEVIKSVAGIIKSNILEVELAGRLGGEEFGIVLNRDISQALKVLEKIKNEVEQKTITTISIGVCFDMTSFEEVYSIADYRLQLAKRTGKNKVVYEGSFR
ncbi:MAG: GGDEF domain-containing protein, partial [bacterium]|nr:GGDEF domain-containing protein [bacterium]